MATSVAPPADHSPVVDSRERVNLTMADTARRVVGAIGTAMADWSRRSWSQPPHPPSARPCCCRETGGERGRERVEEEGDTYTRYYMVLTLNT